MSDIAISVRGLSKRFRIGAQEKTHDTFVQAFLHSMKAPFRNYRLLKQLTRFDEEDETVFWALRDVEFEVKQGDVLGIIGHNGAGKSTLLKILSRITEPTMGEVELHGRVSSLLEVGTGFHPDLSGRENVYMNGTILGMKKREIDQKLSEIIDFSGVEQYIDTPVKFYSSGMKVRLGFAVAAHLEPETLIVDEVLSVGDIGFQRKCIGKMNEVAGSGRTVLFVSHNMAAVQNLCTRALLLHQGKLLLDDTVRNTTKAYLAEFNKEGAEFLGDELHRTGTGQMRLTSFQVLNDEGELVMTVQTGSDIRLRFGYQKHFSKALEDVDIGFSVHSTEDDALLFILYSSYVGKTFRIDEEEGYLYCGLNHLPLPEGRYLVKVQIMSKGEVLDFPIRGAGYLDVLEGDYYGTGVKSNKLTRDRPQFLVDGNWS